VIRLLNLPVLRSVVAIAVEKRRYPAVSALGRALGRAVEVKTVPIPNDCLDGFTEAYYARPEQLLDPSVRRSQSAWSFVSDEDQARFVDRLGGDLRSGEWDRRFGGWRTEPYFLGSLRLIVSSPNGRE
jgi:hypothetical protein